MKIRLGFVSNSSSSSYVLEVDMSKQEFLGTFNVERKEDVVQNLFNKVEMHGWTSIWNGEESVSKEMKEIMKKLKEKGILYRITNDSDYLRNAPEKLEVIPFYVDYHTTENLDTFIERYKDGKGY